LTAHGEAIAMGFFLPVPQGLSPRRFYGSMQQWARQ